MKIVGDDLRLIKKYYGENMMHLCRTLFPTLLETPGLLFRTLSNAFAYSPFLYDDIIKNNKKDFFTQYIYSFIEYEEKYAESEKSVKELFESVGYDFYECHTEEEIQRFNKYYVADEKLCTFNGGRLESAYVFFVVKKNVDEIRRKDFTNPSREDEYSTSVMSIQFTKGKVNRVSIKSRYNHKINNPDAVYKNDLEQICPGLTDAFRREYPHFVLKSEDSNEDIIPGYIRANDRKLYKYYFKYDNVYFCPDNYIIDNGEVKHYDKNNYLVFGTFILDIVNKTITEYNSEFDAGFILTIGKIDKLLIRTTKDGRKFIYINYNILIILNPLGDIIEYHDNVSTEIEEDFLYKSHALEVVSLPKAVNIGDYFLTHCHNLRVLYLPEVRSIGDDFLKFNEALKELELPKVESIGAFFLANGSNLETLIAPNLQKIDDYFLQFNVSIKKIYLPMVEEIGRDFLMANCFITRVDLPKVKTIGKNFIERGRNVRYVNLPNVEEIEEDFLADNLALKEISLPKVRMIGASFLYENKVLAKMDMPLLKSVDDFFLYRNDALQEVSFPNLKGIRSYFMNANTCLRVINIPNVEEIRHCFLSKNEIIQDINFPRLRKVGDGFLYGNKKIEFLELPSLEQIGDGFMETNSSLKILILENLRRIERHFLQNNNSLEVLDLPNVTSIGSNFMSYNNSLKRIILGKVSRIDSYFLEHNNCLEFIYVPNLTECGSYFLYHNNTLTAIDLPKILYTMHGFLQFNESLEILNMPKSLYDFHGLEHNKKYVTTNLTGKEADELFLIHYMKKYLISCKQELEKRADELSTEHPDEFNLLKAA